MKQNSMRLRVSAAVKQVELWAFLVLILTACGRTGLQMVDHTCLSSNSSETRVQEIQQSLLDFGEARGLFTKDYTETVRELEARSHTIHIEYWPGLISSGYNLVVQLDPTYGESNIVLYSTQRKAGKEEFSAVLHMLVSEYAFRTSTPGDHGQCG